MRHGEPITAGYAVIVREDIPTGLSYEALVAAFERQMGRWEPELGDQLALQQASWEHVEAAVKQLEGPHGLMILSEVNQGALLSLHNGIKQSRLYLVGNPLIAEPIIAIDRRASLYVPFRVTLYDNGGPRGAIISFDRPSSFLGALHQPALAPYGKLLDAKIYSVVRSIMM
ncbi:MULTISPECIES: DUF302 domain-containing protein [unclassified Paenibacillus]|uniref:DUF302 domain-containing protein n=1 Tax=unclassified Paenibacillus TaxID=185978 RepID=UPI00104D5498|nr:MULTISPECIES: DUF302 domain-containing protein [unclassified Paenibacillus]NIK69060.1 uncharacterized protein (DUF302 family) [Paenibacillus sp. BK720]TCM89064.1 uncharacterized protein DUF302 [Paenibacillus sp. BK033]